MFDDLKIGMIGGGQAGAPLISYAIDYGLDISIMDTHPNAACNRYKSSFQAGNPLSFDDVVNFGKDKDVITIQTEAVDSNALRKLRDLGVKIYPSPETLDIIQDKFVQKYHLKKFNIPVAMGWLVADKEELNSHSDKLPAILKKCTQGYDGKGILKLRTAEDIAHAFNEPCVLEELVEIKQEISVILSRNQGGIIECYDPVHMIFDEDRMLLDFQICSPDLEKDTAVKICTIAIQVAEAVNLVGIIAVEMFIANNGKIYVNELAPRPQNSAHNTTATAKISKFEQQVRRMLGLQMRTAQTPSPPVMMNILEPAAHRHHALMEALKSILCTNDIHLHPSDKQGYQQARKMGHLTITGVERENAISKSVMIKHLLNACKV
jgi:5-(carboxyamino)imidazole ribonucleotide synthase